MEDFLSASGLFFVCAVIFAVYLEHKSHQRTRQGDSERSKGDDQ